MSIKTLLMPAISERLLSEQRLQQQRSKAERLRQTKGLAHQVHYFHQVDDPYSALTAAALQLLVARYQIEICPHVVGPVHATAAPEREQLIAYSRHDAGVLARHWGLPYADPGRQPYPDNCDAVTGALVAAIDDGLFLEVVAPLSQVLWQRPDAPVAEILAAKGMRQAPPDVVQAHQNASDALRSKWGHYLGATFYYGGEWYWGIDRLYHLELRLQALCQRRSGKLELMFAPSHDLRTPKDLPNAPVIDFFFSLRSPYSAIVAQRVFALSRRTGAPVRLRFVLPMVMRGLPVPKAKRRYIALDAAREARARGVPFGRINDPLGLPTERGLALIPLAERFGKGQAFVLSFLRGVWAEGIDAGSDRGLRTITERAGLAWSSVQEALRDDAWRTTAEANRQAMGALGLWGVPSFHVNGVAVWGQDRLWVVQEAVLAYHQATTRP
jgi:2-hydroxychromene-2-carboxylate isomerase